MASDGWDEVGALDYEELTVVVYQRPGFVRVALVDPEGEMDVSMAAGAREQFQRLLAEAERRAEPGRGPTPANEAQVLRDDYGRAVRVGRTQEGKPFISIKDGIHVVMAVFTADRLAELTEALDRAAMPGQVSG